MVQGLLHLQEGVTDHGAVHDSVVKGNTHGHFAGRSDGPVMKECGPKRWHFQGLGAERAQVDGFEIEASAGTARLVLIGISKPRIDRLDLGRCMVRVRLSARPTDPATDVPAAAGGK